MSYQIQPFKPGDHGRTPWSASVMNEIIQAINSLLMLQCGRGLQFHTTPTSSKLSLTETLLDEIDQGGGGGGTSISFEGKWLGTGVTYEVGDIVIVWDLSELGASTADIANKAGTYLCLEEHVSHSTKAPPTGVTFENQWWTTLARAHFEHLWSYDPTDTQSQSRGAMHANGGDMTIDFGARTDAGGGSHAKLTLDSTVFGDGSIGDPCPELLKGRVFKPILVDICYNGEASKMYVLGCTPFQET